MKTPIIITPLTLNDLPEVPSLQPEGWSDILPSIRDYCGQGFCFPLKASLGTQLVGIGTAIFHQSTAWLGHIIVHPDYRNHGIGTAITRSLVDLVQKKRSTSILLIATALGEPVYKKLGFEVQTQYLFFENGLIPAATSTHVRPFEKQYVNALLALDRSISGENRAELFRNHLAHARLYVENDTLCGFYLPTLGEGLIVAECADVGRSLMEDPPAGHRKVCLPLDNQDGINMLLKNRFTEVRRASRMIVGERFPWKPEKIYSRIGGNLG